MLGIPSDIQLSNIVISIANLLKINHNIFFSLITIMTKNVHGYDNYHESSTVIFHLYTYYVQFTECT